MGQVSIQMPMVSKCGVSECGYNISGGCHAKAITVGDLSNPRCDTFMETKTHCREAKRSAGVGACKISACRFNDDFECMAEEISVGFNSGQVSCLTYSPKP